MNNTGGIDFLKNMGPMILRGFSDFDAAPPPYSSQGTPKAQAYVEYGGSVRFDFSKQPLPPYST